MTDNRPWRKVLGYRSYRPRHCREWAGTNVLELECGHEIHRKWSRGVPQKARCRRCQILIEKLARRLDDSALGKNEKTRSPTP